MARARHRPIGFAQPSGADVWEIGLTAMPATVPGDDGQAPQGGGWQLPVAEAGAAPVAGGDLAQLEAVAGALTQWLDSEPDLARCWAGPNGCRRRFRVPVGPMEVPVTIGVAAKAIQSPDPQLDDSPMVWMVEVDGFIRDVRKLPLEIQPRSKAIRHPALGSARPDWCQLDWPRP